jgi:hypothetical protein
MSIDTPAVVSLVQAYGSNLSVCLVRFLIWKNRAYDVTHLVDGSGCCIASTKSATRAFVLTQDASKPLSMSTTSDDVGRMTSIYCMGPLVITSIHIDEAYT